MREDHFNSISHLIRSSSLELEQVDTIPDSTKNSESESINIPPPPALESNLLAPTKQLYSTPTEIIPFLFKLANIQPDDVIYDIGCGDGRIVFEAVQRTPVKKAVGIDINSKRIEQCNKKKQEWIRSNTSNNHNSPSTRDPESLQFIERDLLEMDSSQLEKATVVFMFLLFQKKYCPSFRRGTRIVRYTYPDIHV